MKISISKTTIAYCAFVGTLIGLMVGLIQRDAFNIAGMVVFGVLSLVGSATRTLEHLSSDTTKRKCAEAHGVKIPGDNILENAEVIPLRAIEFGPGKEFKDAQDFINHINQQFDNPDLGDNHNNEYKPAKGKVRDDLIN